MTKSKTKMTEETPKTTKTNTTNMPNTANTIEKNTASEATETTEATETDAIMSAESEGLPRHLHLVSWNVNGLRAVLRKNFMEAFEELAPDIIGLQEIRISEGQLDFELPGYELYWNYAERKGYSGTAVFTRHTPMSVRYGLDIPEHDTEGRVVTLEYPEFYFVTVYTPNSQNELRRLDYRMTWDDAFRHFVSELDKEKPVVICGDLNVAHNEIDLKNPDSNHFSAGFSDEERGKFTELLDAGFTDTFRYFYPDTAERYTWWSYRTRARDRNAGWRIDYFVTSDRLNPKLVDAKIHDQIFGSDHCPVELIMDLES